MATTGNCTPFPATSYVKDVCHNRDTSDWDAFVIHLDGQEVYLGSRAHSWDAETLCDQYIYDLMLRQPPLDLLTADEVV
jgi:hypothetical protein